MNIVTYNKEWGFKVVSMFGETCRCCELNQALIH
jgi:hypothetical protein